MRNKAVLYYLSRWPPLLVILLVLIWSHKTVGQNTQIPALVSVSPAEGHDCGGVLEGQSGSFTTILRLSDDGDENARVCTWILTVETSTTLEFKLEELENPLALTLHSDLQWLGVQGTSPNSRLQVTLDNSKRNSVEKIPGQTFVILLSSTVRTGTEIAEESRLSFSWHVAAAPGSGPRHGDVLSSNVKRILQSSGKITAASDRVRKSTWILFDQTFVSDRLNLELHFRNPNIGNIEDICSGGEDNGQNFLQIFKLSGSGRLTSISRFQGSVLSTLVVKELPGQVLILLSLHPPSSIVNSPSGCLTSALANSQVALIEMEWKSGGLEQSPWPTRAETGAGAKIESEQCSNCACRKLQASSSSGRRFKRATELGDPNLQRKNLCPKLFKFIEMVQEIKARTTALDLKDIFDKRHELLLWLLRANGGCESNVGWFQADHCVGLNGHPGDTVKCPGSSNFPPFGVPRIRPIPPNVQCDPVDFEGGHCIPASVSRGDGNPIRAYIYGTTPQNEDKNAKRNQRKQFVFPLLVYARVTKVSEDGRVSNFNGESFTKQMTCMDAWDEEYLKKTCAPTRRKDERGHLIGSQFFGPAKWFNLAPQTPWLNHKVDNDVANDRLKAEDQWSDLETRISNFVKRGRPAADTGIDGNPKTKNQRPRKRPRTGKPAVEESAESDNYDDNAPFIVNFLVLPHYNLAQSSRPIGFKACVSYFVEENCKYVSPGLDGKESNNPSDNPIWHEHYFNNEETPLDQIQVRKVYFKEDRLQEQSGQEQPDLAKSVADLQLTTTE